jgi:lipopolysaccharide export system permease protein
MLIYQRYIIKSIIIPFLFSLVVLTGLVWMTQLLRLLFILEKNVLFIDFIAMSSMIIPTLLHAVMPFAMLYASIFALNNLKINKELIVLETAGLSREGLTKPLIFLTFLVAIFAFLNSFFIMPSSYNVLKNKMHYFKSNFTASVVEDGMFNNISKNVVLYINKKTENNKFDGIVVFDTRKYQDTILVSESGELINNGKVTSLNLENGIKQSNNQKNKLELMKFDKFKVALFHEKVKERDFNDKDIQELSIVELFFPDAISEKPKSVLITEANGRITWSIMNILLPLSAICIFLKGDFSRKGYNIQILKSIFYSLIYVGVHFFVLSLSSKNINFIILLYLNLLIGFYIFYNLTFERDKNSGVMNER